MSHRILPDWTTLTLTSQQSPEEVMARLAASAEVRSMVTSILNNFASSQAQTEHLIDYLLYDLPCLQRPQLTSEQVSYVVQFWPWRRRMARQGSCSSLASSPSSTREGENTRKEVCP